MATYFSYAQYLWKHKTLVSLVPDGEGGNRCLGPAGEEDFSLPFH